MCPPDVTTISPEDALWVWAPDITMYVGSEPVTGIEIAFVSSPELSSLTRSRKLFTVQMIWSISTKTAHKKAISTSLYYIFKPINYCVQQRLDVIYCMHSWKIPGSSPRPSEYSSDTVTIKPLGPLAEEWKRSYISSIAYRGFSQIPTDLDPRIVSVNLFLTLSEKKTKKKTNKQKKNINFM